MKDKFLPIGTVVTLKDATKKIMIIGYLPMTNDKKVFDYSACTYPEGVITQDKALGFNHDQISEINHEGLTNDESINFNIELQNMINQIDSIKSIDLPGEGNPEANVNPEVNNEVNNNV